MAKRCSIPADLMKDLVEEFNTIDLDGNGYLEADEVRHALEILQYKRAPWEIKQLIRQHDINEKDGRLDFKEFLTLYETLRGQDVVLNARGSIKPVSDVDVKTKKSEFGNEEIKHSITRQEAVGFSGWINKNLCDDSICKTYLPLTPENMYTKFKDGVLYCKVINKSVPDTVDVRALNLNPKNIYKCHENIVLALNSARAIGCVVVNMDADLIYKETEHLMLGLLWQIIKIGLLSEINLADHPEVAALLFPGETLDDLRRLSPEELLLRWVNYHLKNAGIDRTIRNFSEDIKDSVAYAHLLNQITPKDLRSGMLPVQTVLSSHDSNSRAEHVLQNADNLKCRVFVSPQDIATGNPKLNLAFVANLFNNYPSLEKPTDLEEELQAIHEETREEKTYRNWMNSLEQLHPYKVNYLYADLADGIIIFKLYDIIKPGIVNWSRVHLKFNKMKRNFEILENCNYAVELGKTCQFSLVGVGGEDLRDKNVTLTLALVWQLMRAYTLAMLTKLTSDGKPIEEKHIVDWANHKLREVGRDNLTFRNFQDSSLANAHAVLELIEAIKPNSVDRSIVLSDNSPESHLSNAKYAISLSRRIGAKVYALPEDISEVKAKMLMTIFACLMLVDLGKEKS